MLKAFYSAIISLVQLFFFKLKFLVINILKFNILSTVFDMKILYVVKLERQVLISLPHVLHYSIVPSFHNVRVR